MTNREFEDAVAAFQRGRTSKLTFRSYVRRRGLVMRNRLRLPDNEPYDAPTFPQRSPSV